MTTILGISAFYHDSAAALVVDGHIVAAAQEERFTRIKHDASLPARAIEYCLAEGGVRPGDLDYIAFYEKPLAKFERLLETVVSFAPRGLQSFRLAMPTWLKDKLHLRRTLRGALPGADNARLVFTEHHESHAASAFFPSPFEEAAILTLDGVGEWSTTTIGIGQGNRIQLQRELRFPHSLGLLYSAFTYYCGFKVNSGEYKLMGLAPYGKPVYVDAIRQHLIDIRPDGSFWLDMDYFTYCSGLTMTGGRFEKLFGAPPRQPDEPIESLHCDLAASIQQVTEEVVLNIGRYVRESTGLRYLTMAGGVALNCVANGRLAREQVFDDIWIQPAAGDAGGALGAALFVWHQLLDRPRTSSAGDRQNGSCLGPAFSQQQIRAVLARHDLTAVPFDDENALVEHVAELLDGAKVVGWFQGRMEFGPRALGARSILGDPRSPTMQATMNRKIKFRESFRPFAPCVLKECAQQWFDLPPGMDSPYMMLVAPIAEAHRIDEFATDTASSGPAEHERGDLLARVNQVRSVVPAVTHVDFSARIQTVDGSRHARLHKLLSEFERRTGCPMLVNTSMNVRGEPICCTPEDAIRCFKATDMDVLVLENHVLEKTAQTAERSLDFRERHLAAFQLD